MMNIYDQILAIYPELKTEDFSPVTGTILLQDDSDGKGPYIKEWRHPIYSQPTEEQLKGI